jgi:hypothetical protein
VVSRNIAQYPLLGFSADTADSLPTLLSAKVTEYYCRVFLVFAMLLGLFYREYLREKPLVPTLPTENRKEKPLASDAIQPLETGKKGGGCRQCRQKAKNAQIAWYD